MELVSKPLPGTVSDPLYPDSDAENVGESDAHVEALILLREALRDYFSEALDVYVASDMYWYWEKGNPKSCAAPDGLVAKGVVGKHSRKSFREWEEKVRPCVVFEIVSERTWKEDANEKRALYASLAIPEYFFFDPETLYLQPALQGYRHVGGQYVTIEPDMRGCLSSEELGLRMCLEGTMLRFRDARTGRRVLRRDEQAEQAQRRATRMARKTREERKLREEERKLREAIQTTSDAQRQLAEFERQRVSALETEVARLRALVQPPELDEKKG
jgi:Uma2 family endonuclease